MMGQVLHCNVAAADVLFSAEAPDVHVPDHSARDSCPSLWSRALLLCVVVSACRLARVRAPGCAGPHDAVGRPRGAYAPRLSVFCQPVRT